MGTDAHTPESRAGQALEVIHHPDDRFYELLADGQFAGLIVYEDARPPWRLGVSGFPRRRHPVTRLDLGDLAPPEVERGPEPADIEPVHNETLHRTITGLGADGYGKQSMIHIGVGGAFIFEMILTGLFVFIVLRVTSATANAATAAIAIGLTLTVVHLIGIPITGTSVNPARSLGPALVVGGAALSQVWLFIVAPLIGGVLAAGLHRLLYREESIRLAPEAQQPDETGATRTT